MLTGETLKSWSKSWEACTAEQTGEV